MHLQIGPSSPPKKLQPTLGVQCAGPTSSGTQTVSATQNQNASTWKDPDLRPCSSIRSQSTGCFHSLCPVQHRTLGICPRRFGSGTSRRSCRMSGLPKPWEMEAGTRRRRVRETAHPSRPLGTNHDREGCHLGGDAGAAGLGGLTSASMAGRRGLSALTDEACCAAVKGSAGSPGEVATNASVRQHRCRSASKQSATASHITSSHHRHHHPTRLRHAPTTSYHRGQKKAS